MKYFEDEEMQPQVYQANPVKKVIAWICLRKLKNLRKSKQVEFILWSLKGTTNLPAQYLPFLSISSVYMPICSYKCVYLYSLSFHDFFFLYFICTPPESPGNKNCSVLCCKPNCATKPGIYFL